MFSIVDQKSSSMNLYPMKWIFWMTHIDNIHHMFPLQISKTNMTDFDKWSKSDKLFLHMQNKQTNISASPCWQRICVICPKYADRDM